MIGVVHGYSLEGSGSNIWTRYVIQTLCRQGETVHLICQEETPEKYDFIAEAYHYDFADHVEILFARNVPYPGQCIFHRPHPGNVLPVYVGRFLQSTPPMLPMVELSDEIVAAYINQNFKIIRQIVRKYGLSILHVNHAILIAVAAQRLYEEESLPYVVLPHGSEIEYVIKKDNRFMKLASRALSDASLIFVLSREMHDRILQLFPGVVGISDKLIQLNPGVDTTLFATIDRAQRRAKIAELCASIKSIPRGKTPQATDEMIAQLDDQISLSRKKELIDGAQQYASRQPDEDLEKKLAYVDWESDDILLFAGRIISGKGIQLLFAALPLIIDAHPSTRLIVAGNGPLREAMEMFYWGLQNGKFEIIEQLITAGSFLEGGERKSFVHIKKFFGKIELERYFEIARRVLDDHRMIFTGYLKHSELCHLFSVSDVAVFPSIVREAGPLVFLEALASGCFPIATYFGGAAVHIDLISRYLPSDVAEEMKIRRDEDLAVIDLVQHIPAALRLRGKYRQELREIAIQNYDWQNIVTYWKRQLLLC